MQIVYALAPAVFDELGSGRPSVSYKRFVESGNDEDTEKFYTKNQWPAVRGSKKFAEKAHLHLNRKKPGVRREPKEVASGDILRAVAGRYGCTKKRSTDGKKGQRSRQHSASDGNEIMPGARKYEAVRDKRVVWPGK